MCNSEGETKEKREGYHTIHFVVAALTFIGQFALLYQIPSQSQKEFAVLAYLVSNSCIEGGYLLDLLDKLHITLKINIPITLVKIVYLLELGFLIYNLSVIIFYLAWSNKIHTVFSLTIPIISIVGIGIYVMLMLYCLLNSMFSFYRSKDNNENEN